MRIDPVLVLIPVLALAGADAAHAQQSAAPSASAVGLRMLTWPGKVTAPTARRTQPVGAPAEVASAAAQPRRADPAWRPAYRPVPHGANHMLGDLTPAQAAQVQAQRQQAAADAEKARVQAQVQIQLQAQQQKQQLVPAARQAALPTSIYAPAPARQVQVAQVPQPAAQQAAPEQRVAAASAYDQKAHFYSLHRQYGQSPDPVTLSPQFLSSPSADLADPPPPPPPRLMPNATAGQQTAARVAQRDSSGSD